MRIAVILEASDSVKFQVGAFGKDASVKFQIRAGAVHMAEHQILWTDAEVQQVILKQHWIRSLLHMDHEDAMGTQGGPGGCQKQFLVARA